MIPTLMLVDSYIDSAKITVRLLKLASENTGITRDLLKIQENYLEELQCFKKDWIDHYTDINDGEDHND